MGSASFGRNDLLRSWMNPSLLVERESRYEVAASGVSMFDNTQTNVGLGFGWLASPAIAAGLLVSYMNTSIDEVNEIGVPTKSALSALGYSAGLAGAYRWRFLAGGATAKFVSSSIDGVGISGMAFDAGFSGRWQALLFGASLRNLGPMSLPVESRLSAGAELMGIQAMGEWTRAAGQEGGLGIGLEWWPIRRLALRAGVSGLASSQMRVTFGITGALKGGALDYAAATHPLGLSHQAAVSAGFGGSPEGGAEDSGSGESPAAQMRTPLPEKPVEERVALAVMDLAPQNVPAGDAAVATDLLRNAIVNTNAFNLVEKGSMEKIMAEQAFQQSGCTSQECAVKLGKLLNVKRMLVGSFAKFLGNYVMSVRMVDVETGMVISADQAKGSGEEAIQGEVRKMAKRIADKR